MSLNLKPIYENMLNSYLKEYKNYISISKIDYNKLLDIKIEVDSLVEGIKKITLDDSIPYNDKYIIINESLDNVQKMMKKTSDLNAIKSEREKKLLKNKNVLISACVENHKDLKEKDLIEYINNLVLED